MTRSPSDLSRLREYRHIFFDLDGTLTDSGKGITRSLNYALDKMRAPRLAPEIARRFIGPPLIDSFKRYCGFDDEETARAVAFYKEDYLVEGIFENEVYPEIPETLAKLKERGKILGVATAKPQPSAERVLARFDLRKYFDFLCGSTFDGSLSKKSDILQRGLDELAVADKNDAVMIGDTIFDVEGAREVGIDAIGVSYGFGVVDEMLASGAVAIVDRPSDLLTLLR